jgi:hypothetical protein
MMTTTSGRAGSARSGLHGVPHDVLRPALSRSGRWKSSHDRSGMITSMGRVTPGVRACSLRGGPSSAWWDLNRHPEVRDPASAKYRKFRRKFRLPMPLVDRIMEKAQKHE